jgi:hypothetical protein
MDRKEKYYFFGAPKKAMALDSQVFRNIIVL